MPTTNFYPDADPETSTVDGEVGNTGTALTWSDIQHAEGGTTFAADSLATALVLISASATASRWSSIERGVVLFDTSPLGAAVISAATLNLFITGHPDAFGGMSLDVVAFSPIADDALEAADYTNFGSTLLGSIPLSGMTNNAYNSIALNPAGLAVIHGNGLTRLGLRLSADRLDAEPTWASEALTSVAFRTADFGASRPYLAVVHDGEDPVDGEPLCFDLVIEIPEFSIIGEGC